MNLSSDTGSFFASLMNNKLKIDFILEIPDVINYNDPMSWFRCQPDIKVNHKVNDIIIIIWGDPVTEFDITQTIERNCSPKMLLNKIQGHYYYLISDNKTKTIIAGNSLFSILPFYYLSSEDKLLCSNSALLLAEKSSWRTISKQFLAETVLFNYPLFNQSIFDDISLLPSNSYFKINSNKLSIIKHTKIEDLFHSDPTPWKRSVKQLADVFLDRLKKYLPDNPYGCSVTGGFDGRTLMAASLYHGKEFTGFSFGNDMSLDLKIGSELAGLAKLPFSPIVLDNNYISDKSFECGKEFILNASGTATFVRAHYLYSAKILASHFKYILTGNFGSEIFRAAHIPGVLISPNLYHLFSARNPDEGFKKVVESKEFRTLNNELAEQIYDKLRSDILKLPCFDKNYQGLTNNQMFYVYVFEEIFRKYFGAEIINQFGHVYNRTPFLDISFLEELFRTSLPGVHSKLFELNPFRRYKGQVLYANIIHIAFPLFGKAMTDKGYRPDDLINFTGKINILKGYSRKVTRRTALQNDPNSATAAWTYNKSRWTSLPFPITVLDSGRLAVLNSRDLNIKAASLAYIIDYIKRGQHG